MNKKVMILIVVIECVLSILLIAAIGKAIETYFNDVEAQEIYFTTESGERLAPGILYKEREGTMQEIESDQIVIEVSRPDKGYQLHWEIIAENTSDRTVTFLARSQDPDVEVTVDDSGFVHFDDVVIATITISTKNGRTASVLLVPRQKEKTGTVTLE